ncbi:sensor histidine kinase [Bartonella sp. HY406]|uniref:sensor histidine kinase n=1 Tax=Bartonella sp. HY406 TaxID=2979331 RepID=UPI0021C99C69|nr:HAMP domain-containing sensor histidine kinase [Bartonella sp. HY406]UXN03409.1 HAMP domain-containing histidine kinase [Bartonella sp. HY406]
MNRNTRLKIKNLFTKAALAPLLGIIFILDTISRLEIAAAVFYIVVILISARFLSQRGIWILSVICIGLTVLSFFLTRSGAPEAGLVNCVIALMALILTSYLVTRAQNAEDLAFKATQQLNRVARIKSLGELTASIAHEINQPLAAAGSSADACRNWLKKDPVEVERALIALERINREISRASDVITRIRSLAKNETPHKQAYDLNDIVEEAIALASHLIERHLIHLEWEKDEQPLLINADKVQMLQVITNIILNAIEAVRQKRPEERNILVVTDYYQHRVQLSVIDSGCGMSDQQITQIFDAFWTTREGGTGLGLTLCRAIVEAHRGIITVEHNPKGGAIFSISLPENKINRSEP